MHIQSQLACTGKRVCHKTGIQITSKVNKYIVFLNVGQRCLHVHRSYKNDRFIQPAIDKQTC